MSIEKVYDKVAKHYNQDTSADVLFKANQAGFDLLKSRNQNIENILALGIGDGEYIKPYKAAYGSAKITGIDISHKMLDTAKQHLNCETRHGDISNASNLVGQHGFDLAIAHFVCAYVEPEVIIKQAKQVLDQGGLLSFVSNTMMSFPYLRQRYDKYVEQQTAIGKKLQKHIKHVLDTVYVPITHDALCQTCMDNDLEIVSERHLILEVDFTDSDSFYDFFMNAGWFASGLVHHYLSPTIIKYIFKKLAVSKIDFPFTEPLDISIVLAKVKHNT